MKEEEIPLRNIEDDRSFRSRPLGSRTTAPPGPAAVTGVEKRAAKWLVELQNKAVRLDREVFGVQQPALGPFQRRLQEIGGIEPLVFGQYGELSESFEGLIDTLTFVTVAAGSMPIC